MLLLFFVHFLSTRALPIPAISNTSSSCDQLDGCRTLLGIIWSCISTIFLCTWVTMHPNIPEPVNTRGFWRDCVTGIWRFFKNKVALFLCALLVPEYVLFRAIQQRLMARSLVKENANLNISLTHAFFMIMGGFYYFEGSDKNGASCKAVRPLTPDEVIAMVKDGTISLPLKEEIKDKSKSDWLAKLIAFIQTLWFGMQCIARKIEHLPTSQLEIVTLAYAAINLGMIIVSWDKPRNVDRPIRVFHKPEDKVEEKEPGGLTRMFNGIMGRRNHPIDPENKAMVTIFDSSKLKSWESFIAAFILLGTGTLFGAIHCIAWSFDFPSYNELFLWHFSSIVITAFPAFALVGVPTLHVMSKVRTAKRRPRSKPVLIYVFVIRVLLLLLYIFSRLITLVLAFMTLASLPPGAFQAVHWTTLIPHL